MINNKIVLDIETQRGFDEVGSRNNFAQLGVSVVGTYHYATNSYAAYSENEIPALEEILKTADLVIGFNIRRFDMVVLEPYLKIPVKNIPLFDIMEELSKVLGHRVSLNSVAEATLKTSKSGTGLDALSYWRTGQLEKLKRYCLDDVRITKDIYEYGLKYGMLAYKSKYGRSESAVKVNWEWVK